MSHPIAYLNWSLDVECPKCGDENDLSRHKHDPEYTIAQAIFNNAWGRLAGWEVTCEHCGHEFSINSVEY